MDVGLFRKEPLRRHDGLPPQGRRCCAGSTHVENRIGSGSRDGAGPDS